MQFGCFWTNGQICSATSRLILQRGIAPAFLARLKTRTEAIRIGDPLATGCRLGPLVCESQFRKVQNFIESGVAQGAELLTGGAGLPAGISRGFYTRPTVFVGVRQDMAIWQEEIFGPVLSVMLVDTEAEAVSVANEGRFGLAGAVISGDMARCRRVRDALDVGIVWINCSQPAFNQARGPPSLRPACARAVSDTVRKSPSCRARDALDAGTFWLTCSRLAMRRGVRLACRRRGVAAGGLASAASSAAGGSTTSCLSSKSPSTFRQTPGTGTLRAQRPNRNTVYSQPEVLRPWVLCSLASRGLGECHGQPRHTKGKC